jgi:hypothetical protein
MENIRKKVIKKVIDEAKGYLDTEGVEMLEESLSEQLALIENKISIPSTYSQKSIPLDISKLYRLIIRKGHKDEEICIVKLKLQKYMDGECYGTQCHYGYVLVVVGWEKKYYNHPEIDGKYHIGTSPDFCENLEEVKPNSSHD